MGKHSVLRSQVLEKIIELQTHEPSQFEELGLPLAIKRLAWEKDAKLFVRIASPHAGKYISSEYAPKMIAASQQVGGAGLGRVLTAEFLCSVPPPPPPPPRRRRPPPVLTCVMMMVMMVAVMVMMMVAVMRMMAVVAVATVVVVMVVVVMSPH